MPGNTNIPIMPKMFWKPSMSAWPSGSGSLMPTLKTDELCVSAGAVGVISAVVTLAMSFAPLVRLRRTPPPQAQDYRIFNHLPLVGRSKLRERKHEQFRVGGVRRR